MKNLKKAKTGLCPTSISPETQPDLLSRLPTELLCEITRYLLDDRSKIPEGQRKKVCQGYTLLSGKQSRLWIYQHEPESPILTDFQAFSIVNRRIYSICQPMIWKSLRFPSQLSVPMSFWNSEILPKHGSHVKVLKVVLRSDWLKLPHKPISIRQALRYRNPRRYPLRSFDVKQIKFIKENEEYWKVDRTHSDNLAVFNDRGERDFRPNTPIRTSFGLCPENFIKSLSHCENLTELHLSCPFRESTKLQELNNLSCNLTTLLSDVQHLRHLQHLKIQGSYLIRAGHFLEPLRHLSNLESLELARIEEAESEDVGSLLNCISKLKHLKRLVLRNMTIIYSPTICPQGPPQLVDLRLRFNKLSPSNTHSFVNFWAPHLTCLELDFDNISKPLDLTKSYSLPNLTHLTILHCHHLSTLQLQYFSTFRNVSYLTFSSFSIDRTMFENLIISNIFPKLKVLSLWTYLPHTSMVHHQLRPLEAFCKSQGIQFHLSCIQYIHDELSYVTLRQLQDF